MTHTRIYVLFVALLLSLPFVLSPSAPDTLTAETQEPPAFSTLTRILRRYADDSVRDDLVQSLEALGVPTWHRAGERGKGIKVCILDSGFRGYRKALGKALPRNVTVRSFRADGNLEARDSQHGILCAEIIHHIAPDVEFLFANWEAETPASFLEAVRWARREGAHIISCSVIMPTWSDGDGGGSVHRTLAESLGNALFFAAAGNTAQRHWAGTLTSDTEGWHQWTKGQSENTIKPFSQDRVSVELTTSQGAFELSLHDANSRKEIARANARAGSPAVVRVDPSERSRYVVRVKGTGGRFHLTVLGGRLQHATPNGSIPFPGDGAEVLAVGAVDFRGRRMSYSSCGPTLSGPKPDLVAMVPFPSVWRPDQAFAGTSAAAPQAAGIAALVWGKHPQWNAQQVREALTHAGRRTKPGHNVETGYGIVHVPK